MTDAFLQKPSRGLESRYVSLSEEIRNLLLNAFIGGELIPGTRVNDIELAKKLGVSRTPVREALRGLQTLGIIETLPARITRIVKLSSKEFEHAKTVWSSLYKVLLTDTIDRITSAQIMEMNELIASLTSANEHEHAAITFRFFDTLGTLTDNNFLKESIHAAACRMRLGHHNTADGSNNYFHLTYAQAQEFINTLTHRDLARAQHTLNTILGGIQTQQHLHGTTTAGDTATAAG